MFASILAAASEVYGHLSNAAKTTVKKTKPSKTAAQDCDPKKETIASTIDL